MEQTNVIKAIARDEYSHLRNKGVIKCFIDNYKLFNNYSEGKKSGKNGVDFLLKTEYNDTVRLYSTDLSDYEFVEKFKAPFGSLYIEIDAKLINYTIDKGNLSLPGESIQEFTIKSILNYEQ